MVRLVYVDTCVYLNIANKEVAFDGIATEFFLRGHACNFQIMISDFVKRELGPQLKEGALDMLFLLLKQKGKFVEVVAQEEELRKFREYTGENRADYLHALIAAREGADCLVTRNIKDFEPFCLLQILLPEHC